MKEREAGPDVLEEGGDIVFDGATVVRACEEGATARERDVGNHFVVVCEYMCLLFFGDVPESRRVVVR